MAISAEAKAPSSLLQLARVVGDLAVVVERVLGHHVGLAVEQRGELVGLGVEADQLCLRQHRRHRDLVGAAAVQRDPGLGVVEVGDGLGRAVGRHQRLHRGDQVGVGEGDGGGAFDVAGEVGDGQVELVGLQPGDAGRDVGDDELGLHLERRRQRVGDIDVVAFRRAGGRHVARTAASSRARRCARCRATAPAAGCRAAGPAAGRATKAPAAAAGAAASRAWKGRREIELHGVPPVIGSWTSDGSGGLAPCGMYGSAPRLPALCAGATRIPVRRRRQAASRPACPRPADGA